MKMEKLALIGPIPSLGKNMIRENLKDSLEIVEVRNESEYEKLEDVQYAILRTCRMRAENIERCPHLKLIQRWGAGYDTVDIEFAGKKGIFVTNAPGMNAEAVSEYAVLLMLSAMRHLIPVHRNVCSGVWRDSSLINTSYTLNNKLVGLIGIGHIGKMVAQKVRAFGAKAAYFDTFRLPEEAERQLEAVYLPLDRLAEKCDVISCHVPLRDNTRHLVNAAFLSRMKPTSFLVNTSRGGIVDEEALAQALKEHKLLGAALDVFEQEPLPKASPLTSLDNIVLSSHFAGNTIDISVDMAFCCIKHIKAVMDGNTPSDLVNLQYLSNIK